MKVFTFNPVTGERGAQIDEIGACHATGNVARKTAKLPGVKGEDWHVASSAQFLDGSPIRYTFPVCFCTGYLICGTSSAWHWTALMPQTVSETLVTDKNCTMYNSARSQPHYVAEASELGWAPGYFPERVKTTLGNSKDLEMHSHHEDRVEYRQHAGCKLIVLND